MEYVDGQEFAGDSVHRKETRLGLATIAYVRKMAIEERHLHSVFGPEYAEYRRTSWSIVPGIF